MLVGSGRVHLSVDRSMEALPQNERERNQRKFNNNNNKNHNNNQNNIKNNKKKDSTVLSTFHAPAHLITSLFQVGRAKRTACSPSLVKSSASSREMCYTQTSRVDGETTTTKKKEMIIIIKTNELIE